MAVAGAYFHVETLWLQACLSALDSLVVRLAHLGKSAEVLGGSAQSRQASLAAHATGSAHCWWPIVDTAIVLGNQGIPQAWASLSAFCLLMASACCSLSLMLIAQSHIQCKQ